MKGQQKSFARILFKSKVLESDGKAFEDLFTKIMNYAEPDFKQIKPWGNIGDKKNDGYISPKGIYFQVYAPEVIDNNYYKSIAKLKNDFSGLLSHKQWHPIKKFYFVVNDKYNGVHPDASSILDNIVKVHGLEGGKIYTASDLERILFSLEDDEIETIIGFLPNLDDITIDFSIVTEVISHIMQLTFQPFIGKLKVPDWNDKVDFNNLSDNTKNILDTASINLGELEEYLGDNPFLSEELQKKMTGLYQNLKTKYQGDDLFWEIARECCPKLEQQFVFPVSVIMAKYFECCDIFEEPIKI